MKPIQPPQTDIDSPLSTHEDNYHCEPGIPGTAASLTPPVSPTRGAQDYITPLSGRRSVDLKVHNLEDMMMPGILLEPGVVNGGFKKLSYVKRRSRSVGDEMDGEDPLAEKSEKKEEPHFEKDSRRAMMLPEHDHNVTEIDALVKDETKSALVVNRKLYRAHRQMRLAVLEASKRFEEQQARHARDVILAQRESEGEEDIKLYHAGLVMRHGHKRQVSSESVKLLLKEHREKQQVLVEKATKRGGRGRRNRKKTCSDMSGMLFSLEHEQVVNRSKATSCRVVECNESEEKSEKPALESALVEKNIENEEDSKDGPQIRSATIPGEFRKSNDPFGAYGKYGTAHRFV